MKKFSRGGGYGDEVEALVGDVDEVGTGVEQLAVGPDRHDASAAEEGHPVDDVQHQRAGGDHDGGAAGLAPLGMRSRPRDLADQQAAASVGQSLLMEHYGRLFARAGLGVGQVLLTVGSRVIAGWAAGDAPMRNLAAATRAGLVIGVVSGPVSAR